SQRLGGKGHKAGLKCADVVAREMELVHEIVCQQRSELSGVQLIASEAALTVAVGLRCCVERCGAEAIGKVVSKRQSMFRRNRVIEIEQRLIFAERRRNAVGREPYGARRARV